MNINELKHPRVRTLILFLAALCLAWIVVTRSLAAYLAGEEPQAALWFNPGESDALVRVADGALNPSIEDLRPPATNDADNATTATGDSAASLDRTFRIIASNPSVDLSTIRAWAETALSAEPLNATALRILGQVANLTRDSAETRKFMQAAVGLSRHEIVADYWLMQRAAEAKDYNTVIKFADVLLREAPEMSKYVVPVLAQVTRDPVSDSLLKSVLASNPQWRSHFLALLPDAVTDLRVPLDLLASLRTGSTPPTSAEIDPYLEFLLDHRLYGLAYYAWLQLLPSDELRRAGLLFNGDFEFAPSGLPFDWSISSGSGVVADIVPNSDADGGRALQIRFQFGRVDYHSVKELVVLAPGTYQFVGKYKGELVGPRGLRWRILCAGSPPTQIGQSPMINGIASAWRDVEFRFTVPADCRAQYVQLDLDARMASERFISGAILFDQLRLARLPNSASDSTRAD